MTSDIHLHALQIAKEAIASCSGGNLIREQVLLDGDTLIITGIDDQISLELTAFDRIRVAASGKAAISTASAVCAILGERVSAGLAITKDESVLDLPENLVGLTGNHPIPGPDSIQAGTRMLKFAQESAAGDLVIYIISGGTSALMEAPRHGFSLEDIRQETRRLLIEGATIAELNAVRKSMSRIKAGGLAEAFEPATVVVLVLSDVEGDDFSTIGSGPLWSDNPLVQPSHILIANASTLRDAAANSTKELGYKVTIEPKFITGEAKFLGERLATIALEPCDAAQAFIGVGEPTVTVRGSGLGGRCQEAALAAAIAIHTSPKDVAILCIGSDGTDGPTPAAGAVVTPQTVKDEARAKKHLTDNDSFEFHARSGSLIQLDESTGTNLHDLFLVLVRPN